MADSNVQMLYFSNHVQASKRLSTRGQLWSHSPHVSGARRPHGARPTGSVPAAAGTEGTGSQPARWPHGHRFSNSIQGNKGYSQLPRTLNFQHSALYTSQGNPLYSSHFSSTGSFVQI